MCVYTCREVLREHYTHLSSAFRHYSAGNDSGESLATMDTSEYWMFVKDCKLVDKTLTRDRVSESPVAAFDLNRMVRRLHVTHGYSRPDWPRVIWAVFVDLMAFAMVMWAITGVAMWWQKKSLRVAGGAVIAAAFGGGLVLILCLQAQFNS